MSSRRDTPSPDLDEISDEILAERAISGDAAAFEALIARHGALIRAYVSRIVGSLTDADDVTQEALYTAWRRLPKLRDPAAVKPWLMRVASRHAFAHLRHRPPPRLSRSWTPPTPPPWSRRTSLFATRN